MCVTVWDVDGESVWFIGYVKDALNDDELMVEHLHRVAREEDDYWKYPLIDDIQKITTKKILPCKVDGNWDMFTYVRSIKFVLRNSIPINNTFQKLLN